MPGDVKFGIWMGFLVSCDSLLEATFADETPGTDLMMVVSFSYRDQGEEVTVSETMSMLICFAIWVEKKRFAALEYLNRTSLFN